MAVGTTDGLSLATGGVWHDGNGELLNEGGDVTHVRIRDVQPNEGQDATE